MSWVTWLPKSRMSIRSWPEAAAGAVMPPPCSTEPAPAASGRPGRASALRRRRGGGEQDVDRVPEIGHLLHLAAGETDGFVRRRAAAEALVEPLRRVVAEHPEHDGAAADGRQVRRHGAHQPPAQAAVAVVVQQIE